MRTLPGESTRHFCLREISSSLDRDPWLAAPTHGKGLQEKDSMARGSGEMPNDDAFHFQPDHTTLSLKSEWPNTLAC